MTEVRHWLAIYCFKACCVYANTLTALAARRTEIGLIRLATDALYLHEKLAYQQSSSVSQS